MAVSSILAMAMIAFLWLPAFLESKVAVTDFRELLGTNSTENTLNKQRLDVGSGSADPGGILLPGALVVLRRKPSPGVKMLRGGEHGHIPGMYHGEDGTVDRSTWQQLINVSDASRQKMFDNVKREFIQENGISNGDTTKRSQVFREYQLIKCKEGRPCKRNMDFAAV